MSFTKEYGQFIEADFDEWSENGYCQRAVDLNNSVGEDYFDTANPHFFTGDLAAEVVLIHLNPKRNRNQYGSKCYFGSFEEYWDFYTRFGSNHYGINSGRTHKSPFDHKQVRFLKPFNLLPFKENDVYHNLEVVIDNKLQIELVPYGSADFNYNVIGIENLRPFIETILRVVLSHQRKYVIFCGRVFCELLRDYIIQEKTFTSRLTKTDGTETRDAFELIKVKLRIDGQTIDAAIAPQFAKQGAPISRYGEMIAEFY